ncbi:MAG: Type 1 glutamine amidotransferase-like domain-containing protein [Oscillospiraceae bacterium]|nr:Type 1 glutamine amidotransferase-like domain-containing protein [Oscillospiraceae bacterium]
MLLLCSNGLTSDKLINCVKQQNGRTSAIVVTADPEYKENNYHIPRAIEELKQCGLQVDLFDIDFQPAYKLLDYDVVMFTGGNPYYLLKSLKKSNAQPILQELSENKCLIGVSAGAIVMGPTIKIINEYSPEMNLWGVQNLTGMKLTNVQVLPHYSRFLKKYDHFEERCCEYEKQYECKVIRLNDGEGIIV